MKTAWVLNAGGTAGVISWFFSIPQDMIKTRQQIWQGEKPLRMIEAFNQIRGEGGLLRIFKGSGPALSGMYIGSLITLPLYDQLMVRLGDTKE